MTTNQIIYLFGLYWIIMSFYVINWHRKQGNLSFGTVLLALFFGIILSIIIYDSEKDERKRKKGEKQRETGDRQRRWFRMNTPLNRNSIPDYGRTIPPPPPISRVDRALLERNEAIRMARERMGMNNLNDFKFFRNNVENR
jgi:hypothetical protein